MPPPSAGPGTSWPASSPHEPSANTDRPSCRGAAVAVRYGTAPGASRHRSRLLHARLHRVPRRPPHRRGIPPSTAEPARTRVCPDLLLDQRQVVQRLEYEVLALVGSRMTCDYLRAA